MNARLDDLVGLITSQMPDDAFPCVEPEPRRISPAQIAMAFDVPLELLGDRPPITPAFTAAVIGRACFGCGIPLPADAPFNRCGYCNL